MRYFLTAAVGAALSLAPAVAFAAPDEVTPNQAQLAQTGTAAAPDAATIGKAGAALHDVARVQAKYQGQWEAATPEQKQGVSEKANAEAVQAIQSHGLSVQEYSSVIRVAQNDPQIKQKLLDAAKSQQ
jgi:hypothetical protein